MMRDLSRLRSTGAVDDDIALTMKDCENKNKKVNVLHDGTAPSGV